MSKPKKIHELRYVYSDVVSLVNNYAKDKKKVLEIGSGTGNNLVFFAENGYDTHGIDLSEEAVDYARELLKVKNLKAEIKVGDVAELPYQDEEFDLVLDRACLQHNELSSIKKIIKAVKRVLKPGGLFMIVNFRSTADFSSGQSLKDPTFEHYEQVHFTSQEELELLLEGFEILYMEHLKTEVLIPKKYNKGTYILVAKKL